MVDDDGKGSYSACRSRTCLAGQEKLAENIENIQMEDAERPEASSIWVEPGGGSAAAGAGSAPLPAAAAVEAQDEDRDDENYDPAPIPLLLQRAGSPHFPPQVDSLLHTRRSLGSETTEKNVWETQVRAMQAQRRLRALLGEVTPELPPPPPPPAPPRSMMAWWMRMAAPRMMDGVGPPSPSPHKTPTAEASGSGAELEGPSSPSPSPSPSPSRRQWRIVH